tara:strand:+ start:124214 stop:125155 length:942 start_codon:yes stop_codon:yes gene_type:complete
MQFYKYSLFTVILAITSVVFIPNAYALSQPQSIKIHKTNSGDPEGLGLLNGYDQPNQNRYIFAKSALRGRAIASNDGNQGSRGLDYRVELRTTYWSSRLGATVRSDEGVLSGTSINLAEDLGIDSQNGVIGIDLSLSLSQRNKLKLSHMAVSYNSNVALTESVTFNGVVYPISTQVAADITYQSTKLIYEFDFVVSDSGYFGMQLAANNMEAKTTLVANATLSSSAKAQSTIPMLGLVGRTWFVPHLGAGFELNWAGYEGSNLFDATGYLDYSPTQNIGVTLGIRKITVDVDKEETLVNLNWEGAFAGVYFRI